MKRNILILLITLIAEMTVSCGKKNEDFKFYSCEFESIDWNNLKANNKWVDNKQEAINSKLTFSNSELSKRNLDSLYKTTAQYLFVAGGGGMWVNAEDCTAEIKRDSLFIKYKPK